MQVKQPGLFSRGKVLLGQPAPHVTPDTLLAELSNAWAPRSFQVYKSALIARSDSISLACIHGCRRMKPRSVSKR